MPVADWLAFPLSNWGLEPREPWSEGFAAERRSAPSTLKSRDCALAVGFLGEALLDTNQLRGSEQG